MFKELKNESSLLEMNLNPKTLSLDQLNSLMAASTAKIIGVVRTEFVRDKGISQVQADVHVAAHGNVDGLTLEAKVKVELTYQGDMVRPSPKIKQKIEDRLKKLAQSFCNQEVLRVILKPFQIEKDTECK